MSNMADWRPIATAPRDGTVIDVWLGNADPDDLAFYCGHKKYKRAASWHWMEGKFRPFMGPRLRQIAVFVVPTHWMPLPAPPHGT